MLHLFDTRTISNKTIKKCIDEKIIIPFRDEGVYRYRRKIHGRFQIQVIHDIIYRLNKIPKRF